MTNALIIRIQDATPEVRLKWIKKALMAAVRWNSLASNSEKYNNDDENLIVLVQLLEHLEETSGE